MKLKRKPYSYYRKQFSLFFECEDYDCVDDSALLDFTNYYTNEFGIPPLFRYMPADYYSIHDLETGNLHLSEAGTLNDIFEGLSSHIKEKELKSYGVAHISKIAYIKSFTEDNNNLLMWSTYADNYSGMCVKYCLDNLASEIGCHFFPVRYTKERNIEVDWQAITEQFQCLEIDNNERNMIGEIDSLHSVASSFLTKSNFWKYEKEWRLIVTYMQMYAKANKVEPDEVLQEREILYKINSQDIKFDYVKAVYLGPKINEYKKEHIRQICRNKGIDLYTSVLSPKKYKLNFRIVKNK